MTSGEGVQPPLPEKPEWAERATTPFFKATAEAQIEAHRLGSDAIGPTHLVLAVLKEADPVIKATMRSLGLEYQPLHDTALRVLTPGTRDPDTMPPFSPESSAAIRASASLSSDLGQVSIGPEHLLLAALQEADSDLTALLLEFRSSPPQLHEGLLSQLR
jgi:ATP-dependent Clp protease ATP-binding subunit ClpC